MQVSPVGWDKRGVQRVRMRNQDGEDLAALCLEAGIGEEDKTTLLDRETSTTGKNPPGKQHRVCGSVGDPVGFGSDPDLISKADRIRSGSGSILENVFANNSIYRMYSKNFRMVSES